MNESTDPGMVGLPHWATFRRTWWSWKPWRREPAVPMRWEYTCSCGRSSARGMWKHTVKRIARSHELAVGATA